MAAADGSRVAIVCIIASVRKTRVGCGRRPRPNHDTTAAPAPLLDEDGLPPRTAWQLAGEQLHFVVIVIVTGELQGLRRRAGGAADLYLDLAGFFQSCDLAALLVEQ